MQRGARALLLCLAAGALAGCEGAGPDPAAVLAPDGRQAEERAREDGGPGTDGAPHSGEPRPPETANAGTRAEAPPPEPEAPDDDASASAMLPAPSGLPDDATRPAATAPPDPGDVPEVYMALQQDSVGTVSVIFAIDESRDGTPSDDPAVRITPENGRCNPQEMRRYLFPDAESARPVFSAREAREGVTAARLPAFLAVAVTDAMVGRGLADSREATTPQNVCTRKLWERLVRAGAAG
jgi:hypothetical protein